MGLDFFPGHENWRVRNWQIDRDTLIAIINAQRQNFPQGFRNCITRNICDILKAKICQLLLAKCHMEKCFILLLSHYGMINGFNKCVIFHL